MRIVGGRHRGRRLLAPAGEAVRPTSDRAREALFNILSHGPFAADGIRVCRRAWCSTPLPAPARSGFEALSRGAAAGSLHREETPRPLPSCAEMSAALDEEHACRDRAG